MKSRSIVPADSRHPTASGGVEAVDRALAILATFGPGQDHQTLAQLARATGFYKSTILRLAKSLEHAGYLHRDAQGLFSLGPQPLRLAAVYRRSLRNEDLIRPVLRQLVNETGESASFFRREGDRRLCLYREETMRAIRDNIVEGDLLPLSRGAAGHVLSRGESARDVGLIVSRGERDPETAAIAAPLYNHAGLIGALTLSGPLVRFDEERVVTMSAVLSSHAAILSRRLGGQS